jgi:hypothetical protein
MKLSAMPMQPLRFATAPLAQLSITTPKPFVNPAPKFGSGDYDGIGAEWLIAIVGMATSIFCVLAEGTDAPDKSPQQPEPTPTVQPAHIGDKATFSGPRRNQSKMLNLHL